MRASFLYVALMTVSGLVIHAHASFGQVLDQRVSVGMNNESLDVLFQRLEEQTQITFTFSIADPINVSFPKQERSLQETLDLALRNSRYGYRVVHNTIVIVEENKEQPTSDTKTEDTPPNLPEFIITGKVVDSSNQQPIPGVNIIVKGTTRGTSTDNEGKYMLEVENNDILIFSFIGYKPFTTEVENRSSIDVALVQDVAQLKEVVISGGYYETTDKLKTGSIVKITAKDIEKQPVTSPLLALQGRVPGLEITPISGTPGIAPVIRIRGTNSLRNGEGELNGNYPLYIIDGVPVNSLPLSSFSGPGLSKGGYDPLSTINPANIESIEILKDGDATAIYGSRGANGVILITTKRNKNSSEKTNIDVSSYVGVGNVTRKLELLNGSEYLRMRKEAINNDGLTPTAYDYDLVYWDTTRQTDWQRTLLSGTANITDVQAGISSGTKNTTFRFGGGYHKESLIFPGDFGYARGSGQFSLSHISTNQKFNASLSANYGLDISNLFADSGGILENALTLPPNAPAIFNDDGTLNWEIHDVAGARISTWTNPYSSFLNKQKTVTHNLVSTASLSYAILRRLVLSTNIGYTDLFAKEKIIYPSSASSPTTKSKGVANFADNSRASWIVEPKLSYSEKIGNHKLSAILGATFQKSSMANTANSGQNYDSDAMLGSLKGAGLIKNNRDDTYEYKYSSIYGRIGYDWQGKYLLNVTGRRDGSSRFGPGNRWGNFGAVGIGWLFSEESFIQRALPFISFGKLRGSYGITGSDQIGDYKYYELYDISGSKYDGSTGIVPFALNNPAFAWEQTKKLEGALEIGLMENRVNIEINWYRNRSSNQLIDYPLSGVTGFPSVLSNFNALVENSGWESLIRCDVLNSTVWRWSISANTTLPRNRLVKFNNIEESPYATIYKVGEPLNVKWLYTYLGINNQTGLYEFDDRNVDGLVNNLDRTVMKTTNRNFYGGLNNTIGYKSIELSFLFQYVSQKSLKYLPNMPGRRFTNQPVTVLGRWQSEEDQTEIERFSTVDQNYINFINLSQSSYNVTDGSFIRLKTLSITYRVPDRLSEHIRVQDWKVFIQGQNLLTFTKYGGLDPETGSTLPPLRMLTVGVQMKF